MRCGYTQDLSFTKFKFIQNVLLKNSGKFGDFELHIYIPC